MIYLVRITKHSFPVWSRTVRESHRPSCGRCALFSKITSEIIAPLSSVTRSGTHFNKYDAWTGGVIDARIHAGMSSFSLRVRVVARNKSFHEKTRVLSDLLLLRQLFRWRRTSTLIPLVPNSQYRCHVLRQFLEDDSDAGLSSFNDLWHLRVLSRRKFLFRRSFSSNSPLRNTQTWHSQDNIMWSTQPHALN